MEQPETTTTYRWDDPNSVIQRIDVRQQSNGFAVAYLYANPDPNLKNNRLNIRAAIRNKGWGTLSDHRDDHFALRVSGLRSGDAMISLLQSEGFVAAPTQQTSKIEHAAPEPATLWGKIRANSLQWSGAFATVGNILSIASGIHRTQHSTNGIDKGQIGKGLAFAAADLPLMIAGTRDDARQLGDFLRRLKTHYDKEGIEIPKTASIYIETSDASKTLVELTHDYLHRYANQIKCSFEVVAAGMSIWAGKTQRSKFKEISPYFWGTGFLATLLIPERKIDEDKYTQAGTIERIWMKIQSNPLSIGGLLGYTNNIGDYLSSGAEKKEWAIAAQQAASIGAKMPPRLYNWDRVTPTVMLGANGLYAMSKKTTGGDIKSEGMVGDAYTVAAQIINKQPEDLREKAIESTARFFAERTEIKENYHDALARLHREIDIQRQNPWFEAQGLPPYTPTPTHRILRAADVAPEASPASTKIISPNTDNTTRPQTTIEGGSQHLLGTAAATHTQNTVSA